MVAEALLVIDLLVPMVHPAKQALLASRAYRARLARVAHPARMELPVFRASPVHVVLRVVVVHQVVVDVVGQMERMVSPAFLDDLVRQAAQVLQASLVHRALEATVVNQGVVADQARLVGVARPDRVAGPAL